MGVVFNLAVPLGRVSFVNSTTREPVEFWNRMSG